MSKFLVVVGLQKQRREKLLSGRLMASFEHLLCVRQSAMGGTKQEWNRDEVILPSSQLTLMRAEPGGLLLPSILA